MFHSVSIGPPSQVNPVAVVRASVAVEWVRAQAAALGEVALVGFAGEGDIEAQHVPDGQGSPDSLGAGGASGVGKIPGNGEDLVELIEGLSRLVSAAEACSARAAVALDRVRRAGEAEQGVAAARRGAGVAAEVGLARRESAHRGRVMLGLAKVLCTEMPHTFERLAVGDLTPWRSILLAKESACLDLADRQRLDTELCADPRTLQGLGDRGIGAAARSWSYEVSPEVVVRRSSQARADRCVTLRPAPDTMAYLTALLPVAEGVAAYKSLTERAASARASGDERSKGQVMADALVAAVTGQPEGAAPSVLVNLVMTDRALFRGGTEPGLVPGYGPVPAATAREMLARASRCDESAAFARRLYTTPGRGALVAMDSRQRAVPRGLAEFISLRDGGTCRLPWCDAPIRHIDHIVPVAEGGRTTPGNLQGLCEAHNYAKEAPGWRARSVGARNPALAPTRVRETNPSPAPTAVRASNLNFAGTPPHAPSPAQGARPRDGERGDRQHLVETRTPSGRRYSGSAPPMPGSGLPSRSTQVALADGAQAIPGRAKTTRDHRVNVAQVGLAGAISTRAISTRVTPIRDCRANDAGANRDAPGANRANPARAPDASPGSGDGSLVA